MLFQSKNIECTSNVYREIVTTKVHTMIQFSISSTVSGTMHLMHKQHFHYSIFILLSFNACYSFLALSCSVFQVPSHNVCTDKLSRTARRSRTGHSKKIRRGSMWYSTWHHRNTGKSRNYFLLTIKACDATIIPNVAWL